jgi:acyl carrier protein
MKTDEIIRNLFVAHFKTGALPAGNIIRDQVPEWTSLNHVAFFIKLEKEFKIRFSGMDLIEANSLEKIERLVGKKLNE